MCVRAGGCEVYLKQFEVNVKMTVKVKTRKFSVHIRPSGILTSSKG